MRVCDLNLRTRGLVSLGSRQWRSLRGDWFLAVICSDICRSSPGLEKLGKHIAVV